MIGHAKSDNRMDRCWLQGAIGDALHALSCAAGYHIRGLLRAIAQDKSVVYAKRGGIALRQSFAKEGKTLKRKARGYAHAKQFKRLQRTVKRQRSIVGKLIREGA